MLATLRAGREIKLFTDASDFGMGGILCQKNAKEELKPLAYASRLMTSAKRRYGTIERELAAVVHFTQYFREFLYERAFTIVTDHENLLSTLQRAPVKPKHERRERWRMIMAEYNYRVEYMPRVDIPSDYPSRIEPLLMRDDKWIPLGKHRVLHEDCSRPMNPLGEGRVGLH